MLLKEAYNMLIELRTELEKCEEMISGELYNKPTLNLLLDKIRQEVLTIETPADSVVEEKKKLTVRQWIAEFNADKFNDCGVLTQIEAGWFDWFCKDEKLRDRLYKLAPKVMRISNSRKINQDTMYVWFKNNCPFYGNLYDDFRFADIVTGNTLYTVVPKVGHTSKKGISELWGYENDFEKPLVEGKMLDIYKFFGV